MRSFKAALANRVACFHFRFITIWRWCFLPCTSTILILAREDNTSRNRRSIKRILSSTCLWLLQNRIVFFFFFFKTHWRLLIESETLGNTLCLSVCFSCSVQKAFPSALPPLPSITNPAKGPASFLGSSVLPFQWLHKPGYGLLTDLGLSYSLKTHWSPCCVLGTITYLARGVQR